MQFFTFAATAALMASVANAHMIMKTPTPFNNPNNSPLDPSGSDFPCKGPPSASATANTFQAGQNQTISFTGSAVHGGGSCQLSVTLDKSPTKDSKFKVIHSIEGGCPGVNGGGSDFSFEVPTSVPNGQATFAWTWFNKIGNREMYMNCASITVSGGASDSSAFEQLPDMAIANIAVGTGASCKTSESNDYTFANPGSSVQVVGSGPFKELCGGAANVGAGSGSGASSAASGATSTAAANNGQYTPPASQAVTSQAAATTSAGGVFAPGASSADALTSTVSTLVTVTSAAATPTGTGAGNATVPSQPTVQPTAGAAQPSSTGSAGTASGTCSTDGAVVCNGDSQFGLCDHGKVVWMAVAAGTKCSNGQITKREFVHRVRRAAY